MSSLRHASTRSRLAAFGAVASAALLAGCGGKKPTTLPSSIPPPTVTWDQSPVAAPAQAVAPVKEGPAPLVYVVETDARVRVVDMTTGTQLLDMPVMARQIVSVNPELGVQVGGATMAPGRLARDHRYGIYILSNRENVVRSGRVRPSGTPAAPAQPGSVP